MHNSGLEQKELGYGGGGQHRLESGRSDYKGLGRVTRTGCAGSFQEC